MNAGILYFNSGGRCLVRLCVSIFTLRKVYDGPITLLAQGGLPDWVSGTLGSMNVNIVVFDGEQDVSSRTMKASLWRHSPFDITLFIDSDTVILRDPSVLFDQIQENEFLVTKFSNWVTAGRRMSSRIRAWGKVLDSSAISQALNYGAAINTGVVGWRKDAKILPAWEKVSRLGWENGCTRRMIDEVACQVILPGFSHKAIDEEWNWSINNGLHTDPAIFHYHGNKHTGNRPANDFWKDTYWEIRNTSQWYKELGESYGDRSLRHYLSNVNGKDVTIVTVVNPGYQEKLRKNWPRWMETAGLREQRFVVLAIGSPDLAFLQNCQNVTVIPWDKMGDNKEACLSAFVFGVAEHVKTSYWMKLDCDTSPKSKAFEWPDYGGHAITAHRWGYTRVKNDPNAEKHWLNTLDEWWGGEPLFPEGLPIRERYGHKRIASFCSIERTEFTQKLAGKCGDRLPVPSQDTTAWYAATRWGESINRVNMKEYLQP